MTSAYVSCTTHICCSVLSHFRLRSSFFARQGAVVVFYFSILCSTSHRILFAGFVVSLVPVGIAPPQVLEQLVSHALSDMVGARDLVGLGAPETFLCQARRIVRAWAQVKNGGFPTANERAFQDS